MPHSPSSLSRTQCLSHLPMCCSSASGLLSLFRLLCKYPFATLSQDHEYEPFTQGFGWLQICGFGLGMDIKRSPHHFITFTLFTFPRAPQGYTDSDMHGSTLWGVSMTSMGFVTGYSGLMAARWFLGLTEAGLFPGINYYLSCWYKRSELGVRAVRTPPLRDAATKLKRS